MRCCYKTSFRRKQQCSFGCHRPSKSKTKINSITQIKSILKTDIAITDWWAVHLHTSVCKLNYLDIL